MSRLLLLSILFATQNLFAHAIPKFVQVNGQVARGGRPSMQDVQDLKALGFKTIINLENSMKVVKAEMNFATGIGMQYYSVPLASLREPSDKDVDFILQQLKNPDNYPVFIHCQHGEDRTGMMMGFYRFYFDGWTAVQSYKEMKALGFHAILFPLKHYWDERTEGDKG